MLPVGRHTTPLTVVRLRRYRSEACNVSRTSIFHVICTGQVQQPESIVIQRSWNMPLVRVSVKRVLYAAPNQAGIALLLVPQLLTFGLSYNHSHAPPSVKGSTLHHCKLLLRCVFVHPSAHHTSFLLSRLRLINVASIN